MRELLSEPWWRRILAGDSTAVPVEWLDSEDGSLKLAGESAVEFLDLLEEHGIIPDEFLLQACIEYVERRAIAETGKHPNGNSEEEWTWLYGK